MTYSKNIGFAEMIRFTQMATKDQQLQMDKIVAVENWKEFKSLIEKVLNVKLK